MTVIELISAVLLILSCVFIIAVVLMQESKQGMSNVISGGSADNYFQKNSGRTKEAKLSRATKIAAVIVFVIAIAVNLISVYWGGNDDSSSSQGISIDENTSMEDINNLISVDTNVVDDIQVDSVVTDASDTTTAAAETTTAAETTAAAATTTAAETTTAASTTAAAQ